ncbi:MAG: hypothetical protein ABFQ89_03135, partial [Chloroflexota bacterium]
TAIALADAGVHYVVLFDRPNAADKWTKEEWAKPDLVERFIDNLLPAMDIVAQEGLVPVLPGLDPYGEYWDPSFLSLMLESIMRRGAETLLLKCAVGTYNFGYDKPLHWGTGGAQAWPETKPYQVPEGSQDHRGFHIYEWYQDIVRRVVGQELPLISIAGGAHSYGQSPIGAGLSRKTLEMARMMACRELPDYVLNLTFYILAAGPNDVGYGNHWYESDGSPRYAFADAIGEIVANRRGALAEAQHVAGQSREPSESQVENHAIADSKIHTEAGMSKLIDHYLLLPKLDGAGARWLFSMIQDYMIKYHPTCGHSINEAILAREVTIVGNEQVVSAEEQRMLERTGCQVQRIPGNTGAEIQKSFEILARK